MVRGPTKRERKPEAREPGVEHVEQHRVLDREEACEQPLRSVRDRKARLQAGQRLGRVGEAGRSAAKLVGLGPVLRVVDRDELAAREKLPDVERPRLGARCSGREIDDPEACRKALRQQRLAGHLILRLDEEQHLALGAGIVERRKGRDERRHHLGFVVQGHQDRVGRERLLGDWLGVVGCATGDAARAGPQAKHDPGQKDHPEHVAFEMRAGEDAAEQRNQPGDESHHAQERQRAEGAEPRGDVGKRATRPTGDAVAMTMADECREMRWRGDRDLRHREPERPSPEQRADGGAVRRDEPPGLLFRQANGAACERITCISMRGQTRPRAFERDVEMKREREIVERFADGAFGDQHAASVSPLESGPCRSSQKSRARHAERFKEGDIGRQLVRAMPRLEGRRRSKDFTRLETHGRSRNTDARRSTLRAP